MSYVRDVHDKEAGVTVFTWRDTLFECTLQLVEHYVRGGEHNIRKIVISETNSISGRSLYQEDVSEELLYPRGALHPKNYDLREKCYARGSRIYLWGSSYPRDFFHPLGTFISGDHNFLEERYISGTVISETNSISGASLHQGDHARNVISWQSLHLFSWYWRLIQNSWVYSMKRYGPKYRAVLPQVHVQLYLKRAWR